jgi:hypothetical protein
MQWQSRALRFVAVKNMFSVMGVHTIVFAKVAVLQKFLQRFPKILPPMALGLSA